MTRTTKKDLQLGENAARTVVEEVEKTDERENATEPKNILDTIHKYDRHILPLALKCLDEKLAHRIMAFDISEQGAYCDYLVVCHGTSDRHVDSLAEYVQVTLSDILGEKPLGVEGQPLNHWILIDFGGTVVNIFFEPLRDYYDIEGIWSGSKTIDVQKLVEAYDEEIKQAGPPKKKAKPKQPAKVVKVK